MEEKFQKGILGTTLKQTYKQIKDSRIDAMLEDTELKYRRQIEDVMYRTDGLSDKEHSRVREAYDHICEAADLL